MTAIVFNTADFVKKASRYTLELNKTKSDTHVKSISRRGEDGSYNVVEVDLTDLEDKIIIETETPFDGRLLLS